MARIAEIDGVIGAKITVINRPFLNKTIKATRGANWKVFTGTSLLLYDRLEFGGAGVFCPLPLIGSKDLRVLRDAFTNGDRPRARSIQAKLLRSVPLFTDAQVSPALPPVSG